MSEPCGKAQGAAHRVREARIGSRSAITSIPGSSIAYYPCNAATGIELENLVLHKISNVETTEPVQGYGAGVFEHTAAEEDERLSPIEEEQDPYTTARIEALGIADDWHCLEIGAGKGSMAYWLADRCPRGRVVATDLDTSLLRTAGLPPRSVNS